MRVLKEIYKKIKEYNTIIIHGHQRPDGDCYGSQLGLKDVIKTSFPEKKVYCVGEPCGMASFLGEMDTVSDSLFSGALSIIVDTGNSERISDKRYQFSAYRIKIDHHIKVENYADLEWVNENASACSEMIAYMVIMMKKAFVMPLSSATCLYTGIVTDTGRFKYDAVTATTFEVASYLISKGVNISAIDDYLSVDNLNTLKLKGYILSNFLTTDKGFAYIKMTRDIIDKYEVSDEDAAGQVNLLSGIEGYPVWALFMDYPNEIRIRLRSRGPNVDKLANKYGGGGHAKASGCRLENWDALDSFLNDVNELIENYNATN